MVEGHCEPWTIAKEITDVHTIAVEAHLLCTASRDAREHLRVRQ
jgi:hypothetical protein